MDLVERVLDVSCGDLEVVFVWKSEYGWPIEFVSDNVAMFGYDADDFMSKGLNYEDIIHPADLEMVRKALSVYSEGPDGIFVQEYRIFTSDGDVRWVREKMLIVYDKHGVMERLECSIIDISDEKKISDFMFIQGEMGADLNWPGNLEDSMDALLKLTIQLDAINAGALYMLDEVTGGLVLVRHKGLSDGFLSCISYFDHNSIQLNFAEKGFPIYKHYSEIYPFISGTYLGDEGLQGTAIIPIHHEGRFMGMLFAASSSECIIPENDRDSLDVIKSLTGLMIDNVNMSAKVGGIRFDLT
ncbi:PAS domain-containing protein [Methanococcoides sp. SA1]|nr:PAS domain-containing protein [Methanococcoides sp. SA1]